VANTQIETNLPGVYKTAILLGAFFPLLSLSSLLQRFDKGKDTKFPLVKHKLHDHPALPEGLACQFTFRFLLHFL
jgi:hypothetical protein